MRFLIIDDDPKSSLRLKRFLEEEAFAVDHATDSNRGLYLAKINDYDLLIINQTHPGEFGNKLCSELRTGGRELPVISLFSSSNLEQRLKLFFAGADDRLSHPFAFRELLARIHAILRRGAAVRADVLTASGVVLNCHTQRVRVGGKLRLLRFDGHQLREKLEGPSDENS
jgi:DNA-binding response OmpR family regulator